MLRERSRCVCHCDGLSTELVIHVSKPNIFGEGLPCRLSYVSVSMLRQQYELFGRTRGRIYPLACFFRPFVFHSLAAAKLG
jgi:hypothetical protein